MHINFTGIRAIGLVVALASLAACQPKESKEGGTAAAQPAAEVAAGGSKIVFVYADTLLAKYNYFSDKQKELEGRQKQAEDQIQARLKALENEVMGIQRKVQDMAPAQLAQEQERIGRKEQEIMRERDRLGKALLDETERLNKELEKRINDVLKAIREEKGYDFILSYGPGTGVLMVNDSLDITDEVLRRLNEIQ
jgi:outer membrane protein